MLKEVIVVEGKSDTAAIRRALEADTIETGGFTLAASTLRKIEAAYKKRGIIILTDPDGAGNRIRRFLTERFPEAGQAFIPRIDAMSVWNRQAPRLFWRHWAKCAIMNLRRRKNLQSVI